MTPIFADSYLKLKNAELIHTSNPEKFKVLQYLIKKHTYFGDKILVFCDRPKVL
jgi:DNA excision repair protein ERCC-3